MSDLLHVSESGRLIPLAPEENQKRGIRLYESKIAQAFFGLMGSLFGITYSIQVDGQSYYINKKSAEKFFGQGVKTEEEIQKQVTTIIKQVKAARTEQQKELFSFAQQLGLKLPQRTEGKTFTSNMIRDRQSFIDQLVLRNGFPSIPTEKANGDGQVQSFIEDMNERAEAIRQKHYSKLPTLPKPTKAGFTKNLPYKEKEKLGAGASLTYHRIQVMKGYTKKEKALGSSNFPGAVEELNATLEPISKKLLQARNCLLPTITKEASAHALSDLGEKGDLQSYLQQSLSYKRQVSFAKELLQALQDVHKAGLCHNDLKTANVLVSEKRRGEPHCLLADFGGASEPDQGRSYTFFSPETFEKIDRSQKFGSPENDMYVFGAIICELSAKGNPLLSIKKMAKEHGSQDHVGRAFQDLETKTKTKALETLNPLDILIAKCFRRNPSERPTAEEAEQFLIKFDSRNPTQQEAEAFLRKIPSQGTPYV